MKQFYATRIGYLADAEPRAVKWTEDRGWVVVVPEGFSVHEAMRDIRNITWDWTMENRGEIELKEWERLPGKGATND